MPVYDFAAGRVEIAVGYAGAAMAGRSTTLAALHGRIRALGRGEILARQSRGGRSVGFDLSLGRTVRGFEDFEVALRVATLPEGAAGALLLDRLDGVIFVADSTWGRIEAGRVALGALREAFAARGIAPGEIPLVLQFNKREHPDAAPAGYLDFVFGQDPDIGGRYGADAVSGRGVVAALDGVLKLILAKREGAPR
jgi:hypothetical protein